MTRGEGPRVALGVLLAAVMLAFVVAKLQVTTDITHFLPHGENDSEVDLARRIATGELSRTMVLLVDAHDREEAVVVSRSFATELRAEPAVAAILEALDAGPPAGIEEALWNTYHARRFAFLADTPTAATQILSPAGIDAAVADLKHRLASPMSGLLARVAPSDPFLVLPRLFDQMSSGSGSGLGVQDERFVTTDGSAAVLFLTTSANASDSTQQRPLLLGVHAAFGRVQQAHGDHLRLSTSGANRHAIGAEASMQADIQRVSIVSVVGLVLLYLLLFRSLRPALLSLPVLGMGFLAGTTVCLLAFGSIHGLTLAFGSSLLGVAVDYSLHFYSHHALAPHPLGPRHTLSRIWRSLLLCAATTVLGFVALLVATFPGLRELALFAATGLLASLTATWLLLPGFTGSVRASAFSITLTDRLGRFDQLHGRARWWLLLPAIVIAIVTTIGLPLARWDDGIKTLNRIDPALKAEDDAVHTRVARFEQRRVVVATGGDEQQALAQNERVAAALRAARDAGEVGDFGNTAALLPSVATQRAVDAAVRADPLLWPRLQTALTAAGFVASAFEPFATDLGETAPPPVVPADLLGSPLASLVRPFRIAGPHGTAWVSFVHDLRDEPALRQRLAAIDGVRLLDIEGALSGALARYRGSMQNLLLLGVLAVVGLIALRHRALRPTLVASLPPLLAAAGTVAVLALAGVPMNLMSLMALLMVVSIGDDYGIFLVDDREPASRAATHLSVLSSSLTTILGFGLLALSAQPALYSIGLVSAIGMLLSLVLALSTGAAFAPALGRSP